MTLKKNLKGIVFFDVDGTLIDCGKGLYKPSNKTKEAIKKLKEKVSAKNTITNTIMCK